ncbi:nitrate- and nitrite sensing domain-containing protein [Vibrio sinaloensis]|uniref:nitrate- and nitrite sensing domain-containing protein n=1 Tax=Photobacterium sp. (strain ATCC 43367) TaxID=379097 RepID=UPI0020585D29|nr:nitrate- and nitrite sensing domain-containing protein [Vibrio sinaloensis]UPQ88868.1 nitrate- and nitrite sensing domain-containing protein [Vibrio sinaloensis]
MYKTIRSKLSLIVLNVIIVVALFAYSISRGALQSIDNATTVASLVELTASSSELIHEIQKERGLSSGFLGSSNGQYQPRLTSQYQLTDEKLSALREFVSRRGDDFSQYPEIGASLRTFELATLAIENIRKQLLNRELTLSQTLDFYTDVNRLLLTVPTIASKQSNDAQINRMLAALLYLMKGKEQAGIERAVLSNTFAQGAFSEGKYQHFLTLLSQQNTHFATFQNYANADSQRRFDVILISDASQLVEQYRQSALSGQLDQNSRDWFDAATVRIDLLHQEEQLSINHLLSLSKNMIADAQRRLWMLVIAVILVISITFFVSVRLLSTINKQVASVHKTITTAAANDLSVRCDVVSSDELGSIATQLNHLLQQLQTSQQQLLDKQQENRLLARVAKHIRDSVLFTDQQLNITWANRAFETCLDRTQNELVNYNYLDTIDPQQQQTIEQLRAAVDTEQYQRIELLRDEQSDPPSWSEISIVPIYDQAHTLEGFIIVERDISESIELTNRLTLNVEKAEAAARAKANFLSTMSHEIRTPMNGVLGLAKIIHEESSEPAVQEHADIILESGQHLLSLLNDVLDYSKIEENKLDISPEWLKIEQLLQPVIVPLSQLAADKQIDLETINNVPSDVRVWADKSRLIQILYNLTGNAVKFTEHGSVKVYVQLNFAMNHLVLSVIDTGIGIPEDKQAFIFNSFEQADSSTTRRFGGTGLGLAIVSRLVSLMDGQVFLKSSEEHGSTFTVTLPVKWESVGDSLEVSTTQHESFECLTDLDVLVVDDNRVNGIVAKSFCEKFGFHVALAENGKVALDMLEKKPYDLVLMDNHMPELSGIEATRLIREQLNSDVVIFAYTADVFDQPHRDFLNAGANAVLTKPLQEQSFKDALLDNFKHFFRAINGSLPQDSSSLSGMNDRDSKLTEEELSHSEILKSFDDDTQGKLGFVQTIIKEFDQGVATLLDSHSNNNLHQLHMTLHSLKGSAQNLQMPNLAEIALRLETKAKSGIKIEISELQQLVNLLELNIGAAQNLLIQLHNSKGQQAQADAAAYKRP